MGVGGRRGGGKGGYLCRGLGVMLVQERATHSIDVSNLK